MDETMTEAAYEAMLGEAKTLLEAEAQAAGVGALPWADLMAILMKVLAGCSVAKSDGPALQSAAAHPSLKLGLRAREAAREVLGFGVGFRVVSGAVRACFLAVSKADPVKISALAMAA